MRILFISETVPYPPTDGRRIPVFHFMEKIGIRHEIDLLTFSEVQVETESGIEQALGRHCKIQGIYHTIPLSLAVLAKNILASYPMSLHRYRNQKFIAKLRSLIEREHFDLVHCFGINMAQFYDLLKPVPCVIGPNDCVSLSMTQAIKHSDPNFWRLQYLRRQREKMRRFESDFYSQFDACYVTSDRDMQALLNLNPKIRVTVIPNGVEAPPTNIKASVEREGAHVLVLSGAMDSARTELSVLYFCREIFPIIKKRKPDVGLLIIGKNPSAEIKALEKLDGQITVTGYVESFWPYLERADVYVAPLLYATGIQNRVLEAMALGIPVVGTSSVAKGIQLKADVQMMVADDPQSFANSVIRLLESRVLRAKLGHEGRRHVLEKFTWSRATERIYELYDGVLERKSLSPWQVQEIG
jgi:sugar transferase (PEP-CTERM/EpsH1 system associated)